MTLFRMQFSVNSIEKVKLQHIHLCNFFIGFIFYHKKYPFCCDHDIIIMNGAGKNDISLEDITELHELGWEPYEDFGFCSFRYGSN